MRSVRVALALALVLAAGAIGLVLAGSPVTVAGTNSVPVVQTLGYDRGGQIGCVKGGTLPRGTSALRLSLGANLGPRVSVRVLEGQRVVTHGMRRAGWGISETVTVPVAPVARPIPGVRDCLSLGPVTEPVEVRGAVIRLASASGHTAGVAERFRVEYLRRGHASWWSLVASVARRVGWGHALSGTWIVFLELALMVASGGLAVWLVLTEVGSRRAAASGRAAPGAPAAARAPAAAPSPGAPAAHSNPAAPPTPPAPAARDAPATPAGRATPAAPGDEPPSVESATRRHLRALRALPRRVPRAAWICALIACLNAVCWSLLSPPFEVPDEPSHFAYVQWLAETGGLPTSGETSFSQEENVALGDLNQPGVRFFPEAHPISSQAQQRRLERDLAMPLERTGSGGTGVASSQPPLYYALQTIPYVIASQGTVLDQLALMRLLSALIAGFTGLFGYLFVRETLPRVRWAWAVGGACIALTPLLAFMSGAVNPDTMLFAVSAALLFCLARAFRRGLTLTLAVAIGVSVAVGSLTKLNFLGLIPGAILGLFVLSLRREGRPKPVVYRYAGVALVIALTPLVAYIFRNLATNRSTLGLVSSAFHLTSGHHGSLFGEISYIWQFYLPRLPGMGVDFRGVSPLGAIWFNRSIGLYGWLDTPFPNWVYQLALIPVVAIVILAVRELVIRRSSLRRRLGELAVYAVMLAGLMILTGGDSYLNFPKQAGRYGEPRYLLPLIPLMGSVLALAARGGGRRWGRAVGALLVGLFLAWDLFSQLQLIARYYG